MQPKIYHATDHDIDPSLVDPDALQVVHRLRSAGYAAYIVGGGVRDLLTKKNPKDFDISTSALPEQVKKVFQRQCIIIGRRFRLAHIRFGHKIIEVATFRAGENESDLIVQDNIWGTPEEDVLRRDFTINGLLYDPEAHSVIDYVGGWEDIHQRVLKTIGNPVTRFKQDPVRMIRLLKFRARFGFEIDGECKKALLQTREEIVKSSPARILEEMLRMLESGAAAPFFKLMMDAGLLELLFPELTKCLRGPVGETVFKYLTVIDRIHKNNPRKPADRALLTSCLLYPVLEEAIQNEFLSKGETPNIGDITIVSSQVIKDLLYSAFSHFPRRITTTVGFILTTQYRLTPLSGKRSIRHRLMHLKEFELALKFLKVRALAFEKQMEDYEYWKRIYRQQMTQGENTRSQHHAAHHRGHRPHAPRR